MSGKHEPISDFGRLQGVLVGVVPSRYKISADDIPAGADPVEWIEQAAKLKGAME